MDKEQLLVEMRAGRSGLERVLAGLSDEQMAERVNGDWTRTDVLAHLEAWERRTTRLLSILRGERDFEPDEPGETDAFNAWIFERNRGRTLDYVRAGEAEAWRNVVTPVETAEPAELADPDRFDFLAGKPFERVVLENTSEHYADHLAHLRGAQPSPASTAAGRMPTRTA